MFHLVGERCEAGRAPGTEPLKVSRTLDAIEKGKQDPTFQVRHTAYCAQFQANGRLAEFVPYIIRVREDPDGVLRPLPNDSELRAREQCTRNLFRIGTDIKLIAWSEERPKELALVLLELLKDKSPVVRRGAARLMGVTAIKTALPNPDQRTSEPLSEIVKRLQKDGEPKSPPQKSKVAVHFEKLKAEEQLRQLRDHDPDRSVREAARATSRVLGPIVSRSPCPWSLTFSGAWMVSAVPKSKFAQSKAEV